MNIKEKFGLRIRNLREQKKYSIEHLANISDVDRNYLSAIEKGKRNCSLEIQEKYITDAYRVLLTRARNGYCNTRRKFRRPH
jgi:transcriptional regulator with XRE-family HTH domain